MHNTKKLIHKMCLASLLLLPFMAITLLFSGVALADTCGGTVNGQDESVTTSIDIGCKGEGNPIADMLFAIIRILSDGVGLVVIASIIVGGIQYSASRGDPQATARAVGRIQSSLLALLIFIFGYAILNYLIPAGFGF
jgi:uncharacterized membrane protein YjgN (DUF898 family)